MHRVGIIPFEMKDDAIAILFVTSQTRGRWILPKGLAREGENHAQTCHREGFEEAGVRGVLLENFGVTALIGKQTSDGMQKVPVTYYPYLVEKQEDSWPDETSRQRHWALIEDADKVAYREDILAVIKQFQTLSPWIKDAARRHRSQQQA